MPIHTAHGSVRPDVKEEIMRKFLLSLSVVGILAGCASQIVEQRPVQLTAAQISSIKSAASYNLIDPTSPLFRNIRGKYAKREDGTESIIFCGEVNAKNRMGGYTGFSPFYGSIPKGQNTPKIEFMDRATDGAFGTAAMLCSAF